MTDDLETRRRRLLYRSSYTGMKETDLLLGAFARANLPTMTAEQVAAYEALLATQSDPDIYAWATGKREVPAALRSDVMAMLQNFKLTS